MEIINSTVSEMPFGKYRGYDLQEIVAIDPRYARWLIKEGWFRAEYPDHYFDLETYLALPSLYGLVGLRY